MGALELDRLTWPEGPVDGFEVRALTDLNALLEIARLGEAEYAVPLGEGGIHGETSDSGQRRPRRALLGRCA